MFKFVKMNTGKQAFTEEINKYIRSRGFDLGWVYYPNEPDFPVGVVANDILKEVTQMYDSNWIAEEWIRWSKWRPEYSNERLRALKDRRTVICERGKIPYKIVEMEAGLALRRRLYKKLIIPRLERIRKNELLGIEKNRS